MTKIPPDMKLPRVMQQNPHLFETFADSDFRNVADPLNQSESELENVGKLTAEVLKDGVSQHELNVIKHNLAEVVPFVVKGLTNAQKDIAYRPTTKQVAIVEAMAKTMVEATRGEEWAKDPKTDFVKGAVQGLDVKNRAITPQERKAIAALILYVVEALPGPKPLAMNAPAP